MIRRLSASQLAQIALKQPENPLMVRGGTGYETPDMPALPGYAHESAATLPRANGFGDRAAMGIEESLLSLPPVSRYIPNGDAFGQSFVRGLASGFAEPRLANMEESAQANVHAQQEADARNKMRMSDEQDAGKEARQFGYNLKLHSADAATRAAQDEAAFKRQQDAEAARYKLEHDPNTERADSRAKAEGAREGSGTSLDPLALDQQATRYAQTGNPGPIPRGNAGAAYLATLRNRVAQLYPNVNLATVEAQFKANSTSLAKLQAGTDQVISMENTALANAKVLEGTISKIPDTGNQIGNALFRPFMEKAGSADLSNFNNALGTVQAEFARILNNGMSGNGVLTDTAKRDLQAAMGKNFTKKQLLGALNVYKQDAHNRRAAQEAQINEIKGRIGEAPAGSEQAAGEHWERVNGVMTLVK